jgi:hypothetical protein
MVGSGGNIKEGVMRVLTSAVVTGTILGVALAVVSAQDTNPRVGSWQLNVAKSKYDPGPPPKSQTLKIEAAGKGEKVTSEIINADGSKAVTTYTAEYDGKPHPLNGSAIADTVALKRVDANTSERTDAQAGKTVTTYHRVVSKDGKTMTVTVKGTSADGKPYTNVLVFEKK